MSAGKKIMNTVIKYNWLISFIIICIFLFYIYLFFTFLLNFYSRKEGFTNLNEKKSKNREEEDDDEM